MNSCKLLDLTSRTNSSPKKVAPSKGVISHRTYHKSMSSAKLNKLRITRGSNTRQPIIRIYITNKSDRKQVLYESIVPLHNNPPLMTLSNESDATPNNSIPYLGRRVKNDTIKYNRLLKNR